MEIKTPFSQEDLNEIFKISPADPERVISRESSSLEFKESFGWASLPKYLKTSAGYANAKGGYIVFGIANRPHRLCGLSGTNLNLFEDIDPEKMSRNFNDHFAPEIEWTIQEYELQGKTFGLLYIHEAKDKPVVCIKDAGKELKESDIYYRYRGRSERIKYPELRAILEAKREKEQRLWMRHLENIARIGVREAGIFDLHTGCVTGSGGSFLIDESLLSQISFIKEGEFSEVKGKPALKLIGHVEPLAGATLNSAKKQIIKTKGIRTGDIVLGALSQENVSEPDEFIKQICFESTAFLPVYYFINKSGMNLTQTIEMVEGLVTRSATRTRLIERLKGQKTQELTIPSGSTPAATKKRKYADYLRNEKVSTTLSGKELEYCLQAIRGLSVDEIKANSKYLRDLLRNWFNKHYASAKGALADNLRRAICWVDEALNMGDCK
ncbi:MAG: ATP-binding protein [Desulfobacterales bacterium]|nr:ATP-binding protein [Desulfobacterales bacterium]MDD4394207.1 ATP-binding protein [Desulfobacterales bacterium]